MNKKELKNLEPEFIKAAWQDDISFEQIAKDFGLTEQNVIVIMRRSLKVSSFKLWRKRVSSKPKKHEKLFKETIISEKSIKRNYYF